jgi:diacylglycerol kinase (ATP)
MRSLTIVNPAAGGGMARKVWQEHSHSRPPASPGDALQITSQPGDATRFAKDALENGVTRIQVVGGDGTFNEVLNGYLRDDRPIRPEAVLVPFAAGTGSDFARLLARFTNCHAEPVALDVGKVVHTLPGGTTTVRYFANVASCGQSAEVAGARRCPSLTRFFGGKASYFLPILKSLGSFQPIPLELTSDGIPLHRGPARLAAVANGSTFGGGLAIAPVANPTDGSLDVTIVGPCGPLWLLGHAPALYLGRHGGLKHLSHHRCRNLTITSTHSHIPVETDGEVIGCLPATFEILPKAVRVALPACP